MFNLDYSQISGHPYFSIDEQAVFQNSHGSLQEFITDTLLASENTSALEAAQIILKILEACRDFSDERTKNLFFRTLLEDDSNYQVLKLLWKLVQSGLGEIFFKCVSTDQNKYYSKSILREIIDDFSCINHFIPTKPSFSVPHQSFRFFLPYDQGGQELINEIKGNPSRLEKLLEASDAAKTEFMSYSLPPVKLQTLYLSLDFNQWKQEATRYLTSLNEQNRLSMNTYLSIFRSLQDTNLSAQEKRLLITLILATTTSETNPLPKEYDFIDLRELLVEVQQIHEQCGEEVLLNFCSSPSLLDGNASIDSVLIALRHIKHGLQDQATSFFNVQNLLESFKKGSISLSQLLNELEDQVPEQKLKEVDDQVDTDTLFARFAGQNGDPNVQFPLSHENLVDVRAQYLIVQEYCKEWQHLRIRELVNMAAEIAVKREKKGLNKRDVLKLVAIGRLAIRIKFQIYLYNTQVCTVLAELNHEMGAIAQVKTGEGKSMIVALQAFVLFMKEGMQGHVISSHMGLAIRDQKLCANFFGNFGITTAYICGNQIDKKSFHADIIYGTASAFEFAIMREMLYVSQLFPTPHPSSAAIKRFCWVMIDEMDNLTIDTSLSGARLSYPADVTYDWVYLPIFNFVKDHVKDSKLPISKEILTMLKSHLKEYMGGKFASLVEKIPEKKIEKWIQFALKALLNLQEKRDYVIGLRKSDNDKRVKGILVVDVENTGNILHGSRWSGGLHEFVEVKHNLEVEKETVMPISITHPVFYQLYQFVYGITGTLGSTYEREELKSIYQIDSFDVPTHNPPQRIDLPTIICDTTAQYLEIIIQKIKTCIDKGRPILVLCETIAETEVLAELLQTRQVEFELFNEIQKKSENEILAKAGSPGAVTIATNNAGRGTDIKLTPISRQNGGLHVLITFYPDSDRVEFQARGRGGRQGEPGSSEIVLSKEKLQISVTISGMNSSEILELLQQQRKKKAKTQKEIHVAHAIIERFAFDLVRDFYTQLNQFNSLMGEKSVINHLAACLNQCKLSEAIPNHYGHLSPKDRLFAQETLKLLLSPNDCTVTWKILLEQIKTKIRHALINDFALNFTMQIEEIIQESGITTLKESLNPLMSILKAIGQTESEYAEINQLINMIAEEHIASTKDALKVLFEERMEVYKNYFNPSGSGVFTYLSELLQIDVTPLSSQS